MPSWSQDAVKDEPMLFNCDWPAAQALGGPITRGFLAALSELWDPAGVIVDSRVHMLMPGWWPCIPGWHHDDVPRTRIDGQPDYESPAYLAQHVMALAGADVCPTEFAIGRCSLPDVSVGEVYYKTWHPMVDALVRNGRMTSWLTPVDRLVLFDWQSFHQGTRSRGNGWRWFCRATRNTGRKPTNETRKQVQVYLERPMEGW